MPDNEPLEADAWIAKTVELASAYRAACAAVIEAREAWMDARGAEQDTTDHEREYHRRATVAGSARRALLEHASGGDAA